LTISFALAVAYTGSVITTACSATLTTVLRSDFCDARFDSIRLMDMCVVSQAKDTCGCSIPGIQPMSRLFRARSVRVKNS